MFLLRTTYTIVYHSELWCDFALLRNLVRFYTTAETDAMCTLICLQGKENTIFAKKIEGA